LRSPSRKPVVHRCPAIWLVKVYQYFCHAQVEMVCYVEASIVMKLHVTQWRRISHDSSREHSGYQPARGNDKDGEYHQ
jgi:hypothetical protein